MDVISKLFLDNAIRFCQVSDSIKFHSLDCHRLYVVIYILCTLYDLIIDFMYKIVIKIHTHLNVKVIRHETLYKF